MYPEHLHSIRPLHWWVAFFIAFVLHLFFLLSYEHQQESGVTEKSENQIVIGLKKLKTPIQSPPAPTPVAEIPRPIVKPPAEPAIKPKKTTTKPKISKPRLAPPLPQNPVSHEISRDKSSKSLPARTPPAKGNDSKQLRSNYLSELATWLGRHKKYPAIARRRGYEGKITVHFSISAEGVLVSHKIISPSAHDSLNRAVIKMLESASPMPPVPKQLRNNETEFEYTIPVIFTLTGNK